MTDTADKLRALQMVIQVYRYALPSEPFWNGAPGLLAWRFSDIIARNRPGAVLSPAKRSDGLSDTQAHNAPFYPAARSEVRASRNALASILTCRTITSFSDLFGGEIKAMLDEQYLEEILIYLLETNHVE